MGAGASACWLLAVIACFAAATQVGRVVSGHLYAACSKRTARRSKKRRRFCFRRCAAPGYGRAGNWTDRTWSSRPYTTEGQESQLLQRHGLFHRQVCGQDEPAVSDCERNRDGSGTGHAGGTNVDSRITLRSGDSYDIRWLVVKSGSGYKVREAQVVGLWMHRFVNISLRIISRKTATTRECARTGFEPLAGTLLFAHYTKTDAVSAA